MSELTEADRFTHAWYRQQFEQLAKGYRGATHGINRCLADYEDACKANQELRQRVDSLESELADAMAEIGRMREKQDTVADWIKRKLGNGENSD